MLLDHLFDTSEMADSIRQRMEKMQIKAKGGGRDRSKSTFKLKKKGSKGMYTCPLYMYPVRSGTRERPSYVYSIEIRGGRFSSEFWTKRGVAMLLATSSLK